MVEFEIPDKWISNALKAFGVLIVLVMVGTLIRPSITGNVVNKVNLLNNDLRECSSALNQTENRLEETNVLVDSLSADVSNLTDQYYSCADKLYDYRFNLTNITSDYEALESNFTELSEEHENLTEEHEGVVEEFNRFADSIAKDSCCGRSPDVVYGSYDLVDDSIDCRTEDKGQYELSC